MKKEAYRHHYIAIFIIHFIVSVIMALSCGTRHPFTSLYVEGKPLLYLITSGLLCTFIYALMAYIYALGIEEVQKHQKVLFKCSFVYFLILLLFYSVCYLLRYYRIIPGSWMYYVIGNYPAGLVFNTISLRTDGLNLMFILTTIPGPLGFYLGANGRFKDVKKAHQKGSK